MLYSAEHLVLSTSYMCTSVIVHITSCTYVFEAPVGLRSGPHLDIGKHSPLSFLGVRGTSKSRMPTKSFHRLSIILRCQPSPPGPSIEQGVLLASRSAGGRDGGASTRVQEDQAGGEVLRQQVSNCPCRPFAIPALLSPPPTVAAGCSQKSQLRAGERTGGLGLAERAGIFSPHDRNECPGSGSQLRRRSATLS